jgi:AcrR family transcriptional regulator
MLDLATPRGKIVAAAMTLAAQKPWREVSLHEIAAAAGIGLADLAKEFYGKCAILSAFTKAVDDEVLRRARTVAGTEESARDRVFDVVMTRFDILQPYRDALRSIIADGGVPPGLGTLARVLRSQHWMLVAAGIPADGPPGRMREAGLASVYARTFKEWLEDDDPGHAKTMAVLDRRLRNGERWMQALDDVHQRFSRLAGIFAPTTRRGRSAADGSREATPERPAGAADI